MIYYLPIFLTIIGSLFYHISQKFTSNNINPIFSIMVSYLVALFFSGIMLIFYKNKNTFVQNIQELNWTAFILGIAIVLVELGFLFVYRIGWNISTAQTTATVIIGIILIPIGKYLFKESISMINIIGILISIIGVILMNYQKK
jgi:drug/metabolite transporter (DMT)-like permease